MDLLLTSFCRRIYTNFWSQYYILVMILELWTWRIIEHKVWLNVFTLRERSFASRIAGLRWTRAVVIFLHWKSCSTWRNKNVCWRNCAQSKIKDIAFEISSDRIPTSKPRTSRCQISDSQPISQPKISLCLTGMCQV